jgi:ATP-dependent DNA ligase
MFDIPLVDEPEHGLSRRWRNIMKCVPFEESRLLKWKPPYLVQPKLDGDRCWNYPGEHSSLLSSEGNMFEYLPHINDQLNRTQLCKLPLDGELYNHELFLEGGHELIHSICSRKTNIHQRHKEMQLWVFDIKYDLPQHERQEFVNSLTETTNVKIVPYAVCHSLTDVKKAYDYFVGKGFEGVVIRNWTNQYQDNKRSTFLMKFKPKRSDTYAIVGWNEELSINGEPKGRLGSLILSSQTGDTFSVGAGLDADEKEKLWATRDTLAGKQAMVYYQHMTNKGIPKGTFDIKILEDRK